jgi:hypothetical protein
MSKPRTPHPSTNPTRPEYDRSGGVFVLVNGVRTRLEAEAPHPAPPATPEEA